MNRDEFAGSTGTTGKWRQQFPSGRLTSYHEASFFRLPKMRCARACASTLNGSRLTRGRVASGSWTRAGGHLRRPPTAHSAIDRTSADTQRRADCPDISPEIEQRSIDNLELDLGPLPDMAISADQVVKERQKESAEP